MECIPLSTFISSHHGAIEERLNVVGQWTKRLSYLTTLFVVAAFSEWKKKESALDVSSNLIWHYLAMLKFVSIVSSSHQYQTRVGRQIEKGET